eukprot:3071197-Rhodomonas_salina.4
MEIGAAHLPVCVPLPFPRLMWMEVCAFSLPPFPLLLLSPSLPLSVSPSSLPLSDDARRDVT